MSGQDGCNQENPCPGLKGPTTNVGNITTMLVDISTSGERSVAIVVNLHRHDNIYQMSRAALCS